jgi:hypothetical protein
MHKVRKIDKKGCLPGRAAYFLNVRKIVIVIESVDNAGHRSWIDVIEDRDENVVAAA